LFTFNLYENKVLTIQSLLSSLEMSKVFCNCIQSNKPNDNISEGIESVFIMWPIGIFASFSFDCEMFYLLRKTQREREKKKERKKERERESARRETKKQTKVTE